MRISTITAILLAPLMALAAPAEPSGAEIAAANTVVDDGTIYFGPARSTGADEGAEVSSMADPIYCSGKLAWINDAWSARDQYCNWAKGAVVPRGYELYRDFRGTYDTYHVGYMNTHGQNWIINREQCLLWLQETIVYCGRSTAHTFGGWKGVSSGRVEISPK